MLDMMGEGEKQSAIDREKIKVVVGSGYFAGISSRASVG
jgi:hypothetical protein